MEGSGKRKAINENDDNFQSNKRIELSNEQSDENNDNNNVNYYNNNNDNNNNNTSNNNNNKLFETKEIEEDEVEEEEEEDDTIFEAGMILKVHMENFMCHSKFTITLGKMLNFITGANGSGKSAVVAAI